MSSDQLLEKVKSHGATTYRFEVGMPHSPPESFPKLPHIGLKPSVVSPLGSLPVPPAV
jgi:hypothetical protein